jgi:hypothetical protein
MASDKPLYQRTWFIVVMSVLFLSIVAGSLNGGNDDEQSTASEPTETASIAPTQTPAPTPTPETTEEEPEADTETDSSSASPSPTPTQDPGSDDNLAYFLISSNGQFRDLDKDIRDAGKRAEADQSFRLLGNVLEFSFNLGQLQSLDPPTSIAEDWVAGLAKLDKAIEKSSDVAADFITGGVSTSGMLNALGEVQNQVDNLRIIVARLD